MTAPATERAALLAPLEPPRLFSDGRARRADSARQPHDGWTFVLIPPGTGARPRTLHISVRRLRAMVAATCTMAGGSVAVMAVLGLVLSAAPVLQTEARGVELGVLAAAETEVAIPLPAPAFGMPAPAIASPLLGGVTETPTPIPSVAAAPAAPANAPARAAPVRVERPRRVAARSAAVAAAPEARAVTTERASIIGSLPVVGRITSNFSRARRHPLLGVVRRHRGVDIAAPSGTQITAPLGGRVSFAGRRVGFGLVVEIDHGGGVITRYAHCRSLVVAAGHQVAAGETIATVGRTGLATGPHLHYEVLVKGRSVDPLRTPLATLVPSGAAPVPEARPPLQAPAATPVVPPMAAPAAELPVLPVAQTPEDTASGTMPRDHGHGGDPCPGVVV